MAVAASVLAPPTARRLPPVALSDRVIASI
jgi:hypothetical protein